MLLRLYTYYAEADTAHKPTDPEYTSVPNGAAMNGSARAHAYSPTAADRTIRDAEEFELDGLMTDDEDDEAKKDATAARQ